MGRQDADDFLHHHLVTLTERRDYNVVRQYHLNMIVID
jgi:hypothetical protein